MRTLRFAAAGASLSVVLLGAGTALAAPGSVELIKAGPQTYGNVFTCTRWGVL